MPNQTVKNGLKAKKIKLPLMNFFSNFFCNFHVIISPFHSAKFQKRSYSWSRVMGMCHFWSKNGPLLLKNFFLVQANQEIQRYSRSRVMRMHYFWGQNGPFDPNTFFFWKIINIILIYLSILPLCPNFKKILPADLELWGCTIFGPKMAHFLKWDFFQKTC